MSVRYIIGVDGGGTATRARLTTVDGTVLGYGQAGPSGLSLGVDSAWQQVLQAIAAAFADAGLPVAEPADCAVGAGLAGVHDRALKQAFLDTEPGYALLALDTDAYVALLGAHGGQPGLVLVGGTGSVAEAWWPDGRRRSVGGWGFGVGDEGSGAWMGLQAMRHAHHVLDGQAHGGPLARAVLDCTGGSEDATRTWCARAGQTEYATLAPLLFEHAGHDAYAEALLASAVRALSNLVMALDPACQLPIVFTGSIARRLQARMPAALQARCHEPVGDPADGALHLVQAVLAGRPVGAAA